MTQFVEQLRNQAKWYAQPGHNARDLMDSHLLEKAADEIECLRAKIEAMEQQEPVAWGAFYFGGKLNGKLYSHCDTEAQIDMYIADRHQSDDSNTFRKAPLYALPGAKGEEK